jgi:serine/threonine protein kinase
MAELYTFRPLFPGTSQSDQIYKVCSVMGTPTPENWEDGVKLAGQAQIVFPRFSKTPLSSLIPQASADGIALIEAMLAYEPSKRPTCAQALTYPFFKNFESPSEACGLLCQSATMGGNFTPTAKNGMGSNKSKSSSTLSMRSNINNNFNSNGRNSIHDSVKSNNNNNSNNNKNSSIQNNNYKSYGSGNVGGNGGGGGYKEFGGGTGGKDSSQDILAKNRSGSNMGGLGGSFGGARGVKENGSAAKYGVGGAGDGGYKEFGGVSNMSKNKRKDDSSDSDSDDLPSGLISSSANKNPLDSKSGFGSQGRINPPAVKGKAGAKRTMQYGGILGNNSLNSSPLASYIPGSVSGDQRKHGQRSNLFKSSGARNISGF